MSMVVGLVGAPLLNLLRLALNHYYYCSLKRLADAYVINVLNASVVYLVNGNDNGQRRR